MFEYSLCLCGNNEKCPQRDKCARVCTKPGIYTMSLLYNPNSEKCEYFIEKEVDTNVKSKN